MNAAAEYLAPTRPSADELVEQHAPLVKRIALHLLARLPANVECDDLIQAGMIGLLEAAAHYDDSAGASFETFAGFRIRGAMIDELRRGDWAPRSVHRKMRDASQAMRELEQQLGRPARETEVAQHLDIDMGELRRLLSDANRCQALPLEFSDEEGEQERMGLPVSDDSPHAQVEQQAFKGALAAAIKTLPERDQLVLSLYYEQELNLKEIGAVLGVSESRVCQLQGRAHLRLRGKLEDWQDSSQRT